MNPRHSKQGSASTLKTIFLLLLSVATGSALLIATVNAVLGACGNGLVDKFEQCDDGNLNNGDGCSSICQKEGDVEHLHAADQRGDENIDHNGF